MRRLLTLLCRLMHLLCRLLHLLCRLMHLLCRLTLRGRLLGCRRALIPSIHRSA
jgi:hypothetical protein